MNTDDTAHVNGYLYPSLVMITKKATGTKWTASVTKGSTAAHVQPRANGTPAIRGCQGGAEMCALVSAYPRIEL